MPLLSSIKDVLSGKTPAGTRRSDHWPTVRKEFLEKFPSCAVCGGRKKLEVHHILPFHLDRSLELDPSNLITLCENGADGVNCHLLFGHLGNFRSFNVQVKPDTDIWRDKIARRPFTVANNSTQGAVVPPGAAASKKTKKKK